MNIFTQIKLSLIKRQSNINNKFNPTHFYGMDLWGEIANSIKHLIPKGITLYGEAVGFLPTGRAIQEVNGVAFDYGCAPKTYKLLVYRVTSTNADGKVIEFSWAQITDFCKTYGFEMPNTFYYGKARDYFSQIPVNQHWHENFLGLLTSTFMLDADCPYCNNKVPEEGIVLSVDNLFERRSYKLKNFRFRMKAETEEADKGNNNIEDEQSVDSNNGNLMSVEDTYNFINKVAKLHKRALMYSRVNISLNSMIGFINLVNFIMIITHTYFFKSISLVYLIVVLGALYNINKEYYNIKENKQEYKANKLLAENFLKYS